MPKGNRVLSIDSAAAEILAVLDGEDKHTQKSVSQRRAAAGSGRNSINPNTGQMEFADQYRRPDGSLIEVPSGESIEANTQTAANFPHWLGRPSPP